MQPAGSRGHRLQSGAVPLLAFLLVAVGGCAWRGGVAEDLRDGVQLNTLSQFLKSPGCRTRGWDDTPSARIGWLNAAAEGGGLEVVLLYLDGEPVTGDPRTALLERLRSQDPRGRPVAARPDR